MTSSKLQSKLISNSQKRNFADLQNEVGTLKASIRREIFYPESGAIIREVANKTFNSKNPKRSFDKLGSDLDEYLWNRLAGLQLVANRLLCFFPGFSAKMNDAISSLPILEIDASRSADWYNVARERCLDFYFCSSVELDKGVIVDVYAADPNLCEISETVVDIYTWGI